MASFVGSTVSVALQRGGQVQGRIVHVDATSGTLSIQESSGQVLAITRTDIADLQILPSVASTPTQPVAAAAAPTTSSTSAPGDPAILSYAHAAGNGFHGATPPTGPAAMQASSSDRGSIGKKNAAKQTKVSRTGTPDLTAHNHHKGSKGKRSKGSSAAASGAAESDLEEDFDFDKALRGFDKKKIWEEIKTSDRSDPSQLLVSHNRKGAAAQEKLAWNEPVMAPEEMEPAALVERRGAADAARTGGQATGIDMSDVKGELDRVRGTSLQKDFDLSRLREELARVQAKTALLEALVGAAVAPDGERWRLTIFESVAAHGEATRLAQSGNASIAAKGSLTLSFANAEGKLRYHGPVANLSDETVLARLPTQYRGEVGLKQETASLFLRRIKDAIKVETATA